MHCFVKNKISSLKVELKASQMLHCTSPQVCIHAVINQQVQPDEDWKQYQLMKIICRVMSMGGRLQVIQPSSGVSTAFKDKFKSTDRL